MSNKLKSIIAIVSISVLAFSCVKFPDPNNGNQTGTLKISETFDWKTIETKKVSSSGTFSVINQSGDTIAKNLPAGEYDLYVGKGSTLTVVASTVDIYAETKAISVPASGVKTRVFFPAENKYATVMFEDLFPYSGDKDMNDVVYGLNIEYDLDNRGRVLAVNFNIEPRAVGSAKQFIGIGANFTGFPVEVSKITRRSTTLTGLINNHADLSPIYNIDPKVNYFNPVNPNDQANADYKVAPFTGNFRSFFAAPTTGTTFYNVFNSEPSLTSHKFTAQVILNSVIPYANFTFLEAFNANKVNISLFASFESKSHEVHFKGQLPSKYFDQALFQPTGRTDFSSSSDNWVWAIMSDKSVRHPVESKKIYSAYPNFATWAENQNITNWYGSKVMDSLFTKINFTYFE